MKEPWREIWKNALPFGGNCIILELEYHTPFYGKGIYSVGRQQGRLR